MGPRAINRIRGQEVRAHVKREERKRAAPHRLHVTAGLYRVLMASSGHLSPEGPMEDVLGKSAEFIKRRTLQREKIVMRKNGRI